MSHIVVLKVACRTLEIAQATCRRLGWNVPEQDRETVYMRGQQVTGFVVRPPEWQGDVLVCLLDTAGSIKYDPDRWYAHKPPVRGYKDVLAFTSACGLETSIADALSLGAEYSVYKNELGEDVIDVLVA